MSNEEREFEIVQDDMLVASTCGDNALNEIKHYASQYEQDGPIKVYEVIRREADLAAPAVSNAAEDAVAEAIFKVIKPNNMTDKDWNSGTILGFENGFRDQVKKAARAAIAAQTKPAVTLTDEQIIKVAREHGFVYDPDATYFTSEGKHDDVEVLTLAKAILAHAAPNAQLVDALKFYADGCHFHMHDTSAWDTVSGEPPNFYEDDNNTATVEDGSVAKLALAAAGVQP